MKEKSELYFYFIFLMTNNLIRCISFLEVYCIKITWTYAEIQCIKDERL